MHAFTDCISKGFDHGLCTNNRCCCFKLTNDNTLTMCGIGFEILEDELYVVAIQLIGNEELNMITGFSKTCFVHRSSLSFPLSCKTYYRREAVKKMQLEIKKCS